MSQAGQAGSGSSGVTDIVTINDVSPNSSGNFTLQSADSSILFTNIANGQNLQVNPDIIPSFAAASNLVYVDVNSGSDSTGTGSAINPFQTVTHALSSITTNSITNRYAILLKGQTSEAAIVLKPFVSLVGYTDNVSQITVTGSGTNVTLDPSWLTATTPSCALWNINFAGSTNLLFDFTGGSANRAIIGIQSVDCNNLTLIGRGTTHADAIQLFQSDVAGNISVQDGNVFSFGTEYDGTVSISSVNSTTARSWESQNDLILSPLSVSETSGQALTFLVKCSSIQNSATITGAAANFIYDATSIPTTGISLVSGATATPSPIVTPAIGGTGANNIPTSGDVLQGNGTAFVPVDTLSSTIQGNITQLGTIASGVWSGTAIGLLAGGTGASLNASLGGIVYSGSTQLAILAGTATANQIPMSGSSTAPHWSTATYPATTTSQQILYSTATNTIGQLTTANSSLAATNASGTLAMRSLSINVQKFAATGTYTPTTGMLYCIVQCVGAGGGGGGAATNGATASSAGGGGGAGEFAYGVFSAATIGASTAVTIGTAGAAGTAGANAGGTGGTTSLGSLMTAVGGSGGTGGISFSSGVYVGGMGGTGGTVATGGYNAHGTYGISGFNSFAASLAIGGNGASSPFGTGAQSGAGAGVGGGVGSGGSGATVAPSGTQAAGGAGGAGFLVVTEYIIN